MAFKFNPLTGQLDYYETATAGTTLPVADTQTVIKGSADATKLLRFEVDGFTAGATRVVTPPDADITLAGQNFANVFTTQQMVDGSSNQIQLRVQGHSTQTANLATFENSIGTVLAYVDPRGVPTFGVGASANNIFVGPSAGVTTTTGDYNVAIGTSALASIINTSIRNMAVGGLALSGNSGSNNVAIGYNAGGGRVITTEGNMFIGTNAGANLSGSYNIAIGNSAMTSDASSSGADNNTGIGRGVMTSITSSANSNTSIGSQSGFSLTSGSSNLFLGRFAGYRQTTASNLLIVDNQQRASTTVESTNAILYGVMASAPASQTLSINAVTTIGSTVAGALVIGVGTAGIDYNITLDGETNDGVLTWMEDEDYFKFSDDVMMADAENVVLDTTTGTKIGTATTQKLGFWNATPVVQPAGVTQAAPAAYTTGAFGLDSDAHMQALYDLVVAMRTALVNTGIMKGSA